jgi:hypothetical protein
MIVFAPSRQFATLAVAGLLTISVVPLKCAMAQGPAKTESAGNTCNTKTIKGFERRPTATHQVTAHFLVKPTDGATDGAIRNHIEYLHVLAKFSSRELFKATSGSCAFGANTDTGLNLNFELFGIGQNVHDECSLNRCASALSSLIESAVISPNDFSRTIDDLVAGIRGSQSVGFEYPVLAAGNAVQEVYRHIYSPGAPERILFDISASDFASIRFDNFSTWFKAQQEALRNGQAPKGQPAVEPPLSRRSMEDVPVATAHDLEVEELNVDHHGWGHESIILIDHAYEREGIFGIENATLRAVCHPKSSNAPLQAQPWQEMADRLACRREFIGRDKWLCLYSKKEPRTTVAEMMRYAHAIADLFKSDDRVHPGLRVIVAKFSGQ